MKTLKYALRFLMRSRSYTVINLLGLAFSLACCIILTRYIHRELTVDSFVPDAEHVAVCIRDSHGNKFMGGQKYADSTYIPQESIVEECYLVHMEKDNIIYNQGNYNANVIAADSTFFHFLPYEAAMGTATLDAPDDAVITADFAQRVFGSNDPIGKVMEFYGKTITVRGVVETPACKTMLHFDVLVSIRLLQSWQKMEMAMMRILPSVDLKAVNAASYVLKDEDRGGQMRWKYVNWKDFYWETGIGNGNSYTETLQFGNRQHLYILSGVTVLLLLVGILNFINLYMVFMMKRSKEYGIKKVFGLQRLPLFLQIWMENQLLLVMALLVAWLIVEVTQIPVACLLGEHFTYSHFDWQLSLGFLAVLPLVTSVYPYIRYNYMPPVVSIRSIATNRQSVVVRMAFLSVQYVITALLLILSLYLGKHLTQLLNSPTGYQTANILHADLRHEPTMGWLRENYQEESAKAFEKAQRIQQKLNECPYIDTWMNSSSTILEGGSLFTILNQDERAEDMQVYFPSVKFFDLYGMKVLEGQLPQKFDGWADRKVILNKAAMKALGFESIENAFVRSNQILWMGYAKGERVEGGKELLPVTAVIDDYYPGHLTEGIQPMAFFVGNSNGGDTYLIRMHPGKDKELISYLKEIEKEVYNTEEFSYSWLSDEVKALYAEDRMMTQVYGIFAVIAIVISCLGLFGLSLFDIRQRYREIAIRKVNGAGMKDLYLLLFRKYAWTLGGAFVVAVPLSYYLIYIYTQDFAVKAPVGIGIYVIALLVIAAISFGTLWWQIRRAANIDPVKIMKTE